MAESKQIAAYRAVVEEGFNKGNMRILDQYIAPNMIEHEGGVGPQGLDGLKGFIQMYRTAFPDLQMTIEDVWEVGDKVIARLTNRGTNRGSFGDMPATGKKVEITSIDIVRFSGDKCVEHWGVTDRMAMMEQLGAIQPMHA
jgi:predicted ester cyclase